MKFILTIIREGTDLIMVSKGRKDEKWEDTEQTGVNLQKESFFVSL